MARTSVLSGLWRVLSFPLRFLRRFVTVSITVLIVGMGGGMGGLDPRSKKIDKPEKANQIVCVYESSKEQT